MYKYILKKGWQVFTEKTRSRRSTSMSSETNLKDPSKTKEKWNCFMTDLTTVNTGFCNTNGVSKLRWRDGRLVINHKKDRRFSQSIYVIEKIISLVLDVQTIKGCNLYLFHPRLLNKGENNVNNLSTYLSTIYYLLYDLSTIYLSLLQISVIKSYLINVFVSQI